MFGVRSQLKESQEKDEIEVEANDRDDLEEEEEELADGTFKEKIENDLQLLIDEIRLKAKVANQKSYIDRVCRPRQVNKYAGATCIVLSAAEKKERAQVGTMF